MFGFKKKKQPAAAFRLSSADIRPLYSAPGPAGCIASDRITVDGMQVGYLYRESPSSGFPDSGWRILAGDESEAYLDDPAHLRIYDLNTLCNYDPRILPLLDAPVGTAYVWEEEHWIRERFEGDA